MKFFVYLFLSFYTLTFVAQENKDSVKIIVFLGEEEVQLNKTYFSASLNDSITFENIRFYISNFQILNGDILIAESTQKHFLINLEKPSSMQIKFPKTLEYTSFRFNLGIDSITNNGGAMGGDLDPTNGMYWSWQSGYINFKLEGTSPAVSTRKNMFQFHLGGYLFPYNSIQTVELKSKKEIILNLSEFFKETNLKETNTIMSPSYEAVEVSKRIANSFY